MSRNMEVRYYLAAIALADELSYTRAANRLGLTQSAFSRQICELEEKVGVPLFTHGHKKVEMTDAGRAFVAEARALAMHGERAIQVAKAANLGTEHVLRLGRSPYTDPQLISTALSLHLPLYPNLNVQVKSEFSCDLVRSLLSAEMDMAFITQPPETPRLTTVLVAQAPLHVAISESHELAAKQAVSLKQLTDTCWILFQKQVHPLIYEAIMNIADLEKVRYKNIHHIFTSDEALHLVLETGGIAFLTQATAMRSLQPGMVFRPLSDPALMLGTHMAVRADNSSRLVSEFVRAFMKKSSQMSHSATDVQLCLPIGAQ